MQLITNVLNYGNKIKNQKKKLSHFLTLQSTIDWVVLVINKTPCTQWPIQGEYFNVFFVIFSVNIHRFQKYI